MARHQTTLKDFPQVLADLPKRFQDAAVIGLRDAANRLVGYTVEEIIKGDVVAHGTLKDSVRAHNLADGAFVAIEAPHADAVEHGSRPHWPPIQPLIDWALVKGLANTEAEAKSIGFLVARAISRRGTRPRKYFAKAVARIKPDIVKHMVAEWNKL